MPGRHAQGLADRRPMPLAVAIAFSGSLSGLSTNALALADGKVTVFADESVSYSDNVFQLPSSLSPPVVNGSNPRSDWYYTITLGLTFDYPVSRQKFQGGYTWYDSHYNHYST